MRVTLILLFVFILFGCSKPVTEYGEYPISPVAIKDVVINDNFWLPKIKIIQDSTILYAFDKCSAEGRMDNFLIAGKVMEGKTKGQMPFDDTDLYKIIEGASYTLISKPNPALEEYLDSIISIIKTGQEADGYLTTWFTIDRLNPPAKWVNPSKNRWENEVSSHELYNSGHLFEAASSHYLATGKTNFLDIALKNADLLVENFGPGKLETPPGHQIVETGLIKLFLITKNAKYLELAKFFLDERGDSTSHKLYGEYSQDHESVTEQTEAVGHAVRAEYMYAAMTDIAVLYKDTAYKKAINAIWENTVNAKTYLTGGLGARHDREAFGNNYELPNLTAYNETCAAIGSVYWNQRLFMFTGDVKYFDIIERTLYNGLISGISVDGKNFFYPNPLESDGKYAFNQRACTRSPWFSCSCCPTNMIRFIPSIPGLIYATKGDEIFVNLYISNNAKLTVNEKDVDISMQTSYPLDGKVSINLNPQEKGNFTVRLRIPGWARNQVIPGDLYSYLQNNSKEIALIINGVEQKIAVTDGYLVITRDWAKGDIIEMTIPMTVQTVIANEKVAENKGKVAFEYGPLVYCAEEADNKDLNTISVSESASLEIEEFSLLNNRINRISGGNDGEKLTLIPYYLWSNRGVQGMKVWFPIK